MRAIFIVLLLVIAPGCERREASQEANSDGASDVQQIVSSEEMILDLTKRLTSLNHSVMNLVLPFGHARGLFADECMIADLGDQAESEPLNDYLTRKRWRIKAPAKVSELRVWEPFIAGMKYFESAKFSLVDGRFDDDLAAFHTNMSFAGHARLEDGSFGHATARVAVTWAWADELRTRMHIIEWRTRHFENVVSDQRLFTDVTHDAIRNPALANELAMSVHQELNRMLIGGKTLQRRADDAYPLFFPEVTLEHPAVSVIDLNGDGFDDFFLGLPHTRALFFANNGDGTFSEIARDIGLDLERDVTCALFADYDNDGDQDVFIGRARKRAMYMENVEGMFRDATDSRIGFALPFMVSSISAADMNRDGLLDVYFSTYSPNEGSHGVDVEGDNMWPNLFLDEDEQIEFSRRRSGANPFIDMVGPPNLLLENAGERFRIAGANASVAQWRKSFQSTWSDFDRDGDPDLYVNNDFAPDDLFRNDGAEGFVRVNDAVGLDEIGFGMGVTWGDHNNDGTLDLYVSNMYSKAGRRITQQIQALDPSFRQIAAGNFLYELHDGRFDLVSTSDGEQAAVAKAGWSWGGQFTDIDNDGRLDIVVASGYYSAPPELAEEVDL